MSEESENYTIFNSRALIDVVGNVTDEALKATKIKQLIGVLGGRFFNWAQRKSLFPYIWELNVVHLKWLQLEHLDLMLKGSVCFSVHLQDNAMFC